jgi:hypothetical protein
MCDGGVKEDSRRSTRTPNGFAAGMEDPPPAHTRMLPPLRGRELLIGCCRKNAKCSYTPATSASGNVATCVLVALVIFALMTVLRPALA